LVLSKQPRLERGTVVPEPHRIRNWIKYFKALPEIIRLTALIYIRLPLSLRNVEDPLHDRSIAITHETARLCQIETVRWVLANEIRTLERRLMAWHREAETSRRLETIPGVGMVLSD
jgi:transposase